MVMSRLAVLIVLLSLQVALHAQDSTRTNSRAAMHASGFQREIRAEGSFAYGANSLWNELPVALWQGGYLDHELRDRSRDAMRVRNTAGYAIEARLTYLGPTQDGRRTIISLAHQEQLGLRYAPDLYNLTFFGNAAYEGRRADVGPARFAHMRYQTIGFGLVSGDLSRMARIDLVIGQTLNTAEVRWADLYTGTDGRVLRSNIRGNYLRSDTTASANNAMNGIGIAFNGHWRIPIRPNTHGLEVVLEARDLGFCAWNARSLKLERDTTVVFEGITVDNILELDEMILGEDALLDTFGLRYRAAATATWLPFVLRGTARLPFEERWVLTASIEQRNLPGFVPQLAMGGERQLGARWTATGQLAMGGFGGLRLGGGVQAAVGKRWLLEAGSPHLPAFFTGRTRGAGLWFAASLGI